MEWDEEVDVVVAGSGGVLAGAYTAAREGLDVAIFEASGTFGGTTAYSGGGMWFPCNPVLRRSGVEDDSIDAALTYYHSVVGDRTQYELQEAFVRGGAPLVTYLEEDPYLVFEPLPWPDYYGKAPEARTDGGRHMVAAPMSSDDVGGLRDLIRPPLNTERLDDPLPDMLVGGQALIARLLLAISEQPSASLHLDSPLVELVMQDSAVTGAVIERHGKPRAVRARRGVLLGTGGFEANDALRQRFGVPGVARDTMGVHTNDGRALLAALSVGADTDLLDQAWWSPGLTHPDGTSTFSLLITGGIFVDAQGRRFTNESGPYDRIGRDVLAAAATGDVTFPYWFVYDDREGVVPPVRSTSVSMVDSEDYIAAGLWRTADTLEELAEKIGVPSSELTHSVARYNQHVAAGHDPDFGRGDEAYDRAFSGGRSPMVPVEHGPFHAAAFGLSDLGTKGGLRTDASGRVLDHSGVVISGLYAAGNAMAAPSGLAYPAGGNPVGTSMVFSHLAALDMAG